MAKRAVCKKNKMFVDDKNFPKQFQDEPTTTSWQGRVFILDPKKSFIADKVGAEIKGEYAIKVR
ncbi:MAG: transcription elongation factor subunit Spt4 [Nanoarchaeota archaeon]